METLGPHFFPPHYEVVTQINSIKENSSPVSIMSSKYITGIIQLCPAKHILSLSLSLPPSLSVSLFLSVSIHIYIYYIKALFKKNKKRKIAHEGVDQLCDTLLGHEPPA